MWQWAGAAAVLVVAATATYLGTRTEDADEPQSAPVVGGDLHTVAVVGDALYVGGHEAVAVSHDGGRSWQRIASLDRADAMGWAQTGEALFVGGHPGLYRSTDQGVTFSKVTGGAAVTDVHALGAAAGTIYLASPVSGLLVSVDGGNSWQVRDPQAGRSFMGTILVDPADPSRLVAADMAAGLVTSSDGGATWRPLGGPDGVMSATWNPADVNEIVVLGMGSAARSSDGGATWQPIPVPAGGRAVSFDSTGATIYVGVLDGQRARLFRSDDGGATWTPTA